MICIDDIRDKHLLFTVDDCNRNEIKRDSKPDGSGTGCFIVGVLGVHNVLVFHCEVFEHELRRRSRWYHCIHTGKGELGASR